ncbi:hypothetical protein [Xylanimonas sp. McL0601]|uniref:hypothetical protein n=1 Tax=Xylanimonas sp. McL0601 TaxID=3414739 RepID=UPI003CF0CFEE
MTIAVARAERLDHLPLVVAGLSGSGSEVPEAEPQGPTTVVVHDRIGTGGVFAAAFVLAIVGASMLTELKGRRLD